MSPVVPTKEVVVLQIFPFKLRLLPLCGSPVSHDETFTSLDIVSFLPTSLSYGLVVPGLPFFYTSIRHRVPGPF